MKLGYVILYVNEVERSLEFYERAFGLKRRFIDETKKYAELETGATRLAFVANELVQQMISVAIAPANPQQPAPPIDLAMVSDNVESAFARALKAGAVKVKDPQKMPWGQTVSYVRDLNGFLVEICTPMP